MERWNFEADDESVMVCYGEHHRSQDCEYKRLNHHQVLKILNAMKSELIKYRHNSETVQKIEPFENYIETIL